MTPRKPPRWEVRVSVYRNDRRVKISDARGDEGDPLEYILLDATNDLERWAQEVDAQDEGAKR